MREPWPDNLRGLAVIWMIIFHTSYDMQMLNFVNWDFGGGFWFAFPRVIAFTFLFCVGVSLNYGHRPKINWHSLGKRSLKIGGAALLISASTYLMFPAQWIYFGTLHCIFVGSILGALVVNHRSLAWALLAVILLCQYVLNFDIRWISGVLQKPSMDFIPIYPWFWAILSGILVGPHLSMIRAVREMPEIRPLSIPGRHSLKIYLLHQPLIFGILWGLKNLM